MANPMKMHATVTDLVRCGPGVYKVEFSSESSYPRFRPGQFLHLTVDDFDPSTGFWPESRVFSIASRPGADRVAIVYSVKGTYTKKMESYLAPGKTVWLKFPYGSFIIDASLKDGRDVALIAGGTGVSPFIPFIEANNETGWKIGSRVHLAYGLRSASNLVFGEVYGCALQFPAFSADFYVEDDSELPQFPRERVRKGMLSIDVVVRSLPRVGAWVYFLSVPPAMLRRFREDLSAMGVPADDIRIDEW